MSDQESTSHAMDGADREEMLSALFGQMVLQQTNIAMMLLGRMPHPQTGRTTRDMDAARLFIDQLEMLEAKTKGNLTKDEETLLKQSLMSLRLAFVEAVESPGQPQPAEAPAAPDSASGPDTGAAAGKPASGTPPSDDESKKKFSKKY